MKLVPSSAAPKVPFQRTPISDYVRDVADLERAVESGSNVIESRVHQLSMAHIGHRVRKSHRLNSNGRGRAMRR